ncbi:MAG: proline--tRNA ligase, partial [Bacteroidales bacterium]|nr:proline--tRNA ligase [Candidatus Colicola faecequi]
MTPGFKFAEYELRGVPVRLAIGARDLEAGTIEVARRDTLTKETRSLEGIVEHLQALLEEIQSNIYQKALNFRLSNTRNCDSWEEFKEEIQKGGFLACHWDGTAETEERIKEETKATIRCIPLDAVEEEGTCIYSGKPSHKRVIFAMAY